MVVVSCFARQGIQNSSTVVDEDRLTGVDACNQWAVVEVSDYLCFVLGRYRLNARDFNRSLRFVCTFTCRSCVRVCFIGTDSVTLNIGEAVRGSTVGGAAMRLAVYAFLS